MWKPRRGGKHAARAGGLSPAGKFTWSTALAAPGSMARDGARVPSVLEVGLGLAPHACYEGELLTSRPAVRNTPPIDESRAEEGRGRPKRI